ncbi:HAMP domain-containing sensor histidine kinase [Sorangium sp. So ce590]|uniref:sensor histidine kinase n=1 Tax=Sorangium sp. So ce590 TaxID=3133317 RepID=UPI003F5FFE1B
MLERRRQDDDDATTTNDHPLLTGMLTMSALNPQPTGTLDVRRPARASEHDGGDGFRDEFLTLASHELKTPLTSLALQVQRMKRMSERQAGDASTWVASLEVVGRQVNRLARLCDDMLQAIALRAGQLAPERQSVDLGALVREVVAGLAIELSAPSTSISVDTPEGVVGRWHREQIGRLVLNLVKNAIMFGEGRPISVEVKASPRGAQLLVRDHGTGIADEDQERIFACFERVGDVEHFGGLGLGLYLAREIARAHGGQIGVESSLGRGSTFLVDLPLGPEPAIQASVARLP